MVWCCRTAQENVWVYGGSISASTSDGSRFLTGFGFDPYIDIHTNNYSVVYGVYEVQDSAFSPTSYTYSQDTSLFVAAQGSQMNVYDAKSHGIRVSVLFCFLSAAKLIFLCLHWNSTPSRLRCRVNHLHKLLTMRSSPLITRTCLWISTVSTIKARTTSSLLVFTLSLLLHQCMIL